MPEPRKRARGAGRKPRGEAMAEHRHTVRFSPSEEVRILRAAGKRPVASWLHDVALAAAPPVLDDPEELRAALERAG